MSPSPKTLVIATRGSRLALAQTEIVSALLRARHPELDIEVMVVSTTGDRDKRPFAEIGGKGLFTGEVEAAIVAREADIAVHSAKDLTAELAPGCAIVCIPARASVHDVVVGGSGASGEERLASLPPGARVGTSSLRRRALLMEWRPDLEAVEFRGNVDTRLRKVADGEVDAAILAAAGIERLGVEADVAAIDPGRWLPAPSQGAIAIEARVDRADLEALLAPFEDPASRAQVEAERAFARVMEGGCSVPLGCYSRVAEGRLVVDGFLGLPDGTHSMRDRISGGLHEGAALGAELAEAIISSGGREILDDLAEFERPPVPEP
ncbi:MAG TPA: hydroxymethylbilane synthase [Actinomycetota bacterium]|nr:hydroxymethylbilane synthase [Actinomycetota bacterium]